MEMTTVAKISAILMLTVVSIGMFDAVWRSTSKTGAATAPAFNIALTGN